MASMSLLSKIMTLGSSFRRVAKPHLSKLRCSCMAFVRLVLNCSTLAIQRWHFVARAWNRLKSLSNVKRCKTVKNPMLLMPVQVGCIRLAETWKRRRRVARVLARSAMLQGFYNKSWQSGTSTSLYWFTVRVPSPHFSGLSFLESLTVTVVRIESKGMEHSNRRLFKFWHAFLCDEYKSTRNLFQIFISTAFHTSYRGWRCMIQLFHELASWDISSPFLCFYMDCWFCH